MSTIDALSPDVHAYARLLIDAGFTVYADDRPGRHFPQRTTSWFHYSRKVDGVECFGTYDDGSDGLNGPSHTMPLTPSRLNGSGAHVGAQWGDPLTLGLDDIPAESVRMAAIVARPQNYCPMNAEPTHEATQAANRPSGAPKRFYTGATLRNATPGGIGTIYTPVVL